MSYFDVGKKTLLFPMIIVLVGCGTSKLSKKEAISLGEDFILQNGYTDEKMIDSVEVRTWKVLLEPKAVFCSKGFSRWNVGFRVKRDSTRYMVVRIYRNGRKIQMQHQDLQQNQ